MESQPITVSIEKAAELLSLSKHTVRKYEREGRIRATRIGTRVLIPMAELNRIAAEGLRSNVNNN